MRPNPSLRENTDHCVEPAGNETVAAADGERPVRGRRRRARRPVAAAGNGQMQRYGQQRNAGIDRHGTTPAERFRERRAERPKHG